MPWISSNVKKLMRNRDFHKKQAIKHASSAHWNNYKTELPPKANCSLNKGISMRDVGTQTNISLVNCSDKDGEFPAR